MDHKMLAEELIGSAPDSKLPRPGNQIPDPDSFDQPLQDDEVGQVFCVGCGTLLPFGDQFLETVASDVAADFGEGTHYLQVQSCPACDKAGFTAITAVLIPL